MSKALLAQAKQSAGNDHARFLSTLHQLEQLAPLLSQRQQLHVAYWEAWEARNRGDYPRSTRMFLQIISRASDDPLLVTRAKNRLILIYMINRNYVKAFTLANALIENLDKIPDPSVRDNVLILANEILLWQKQYGLAMKYAKQLKANATSDKALCKAEYVETNTLLQRGGVLTSSSPQFQKTIDTCLAANMLSYADTLRLNWAGLMDDEGHPRQALAFLDRIAPDILKTGFQEHIKSLYVTRAQAYLNLGKYMLARKWAQATLSASATGSFNWTMQAAYKVLYKAQEHMGQYAAALASQKNYVSQYRDSMRDDKAQALAYLIVQQDILGKRLKLEKLGHQNRILKLRQSLNRQSAETSRLYILLLMMALAFIVLWAYLTKHSQLRFRKIARDDDLTGAYNRQHFFDQCVQSLERLKKTGGHACLLTLDLDHLKRINDIHGHVAGDAVLKHVANIIRRGLRTSDILGRLGGEEFAILMPGCTREQGAVIGNRIRAILARSPTVTDGQTRIMVTTSIGLVSTEECGHALRPLLLNADAALYEAKDLGRNRLVIGTGDDARTFAQDRQGRHNSIPSQVRPD